MSRPALPEPAAMDCRAAAIYCGISYHSLRSLALAGKIPLIQLPATTGKGHMRKLIFYRADLDSFLQRFRIENKPTISGLKQMRSAR